MLNAELRAELYQQRQLVKAYQSLMAYWKQRCYEADEYIDTILELVNPPLK